MKDSCESKSHWWLLKATSIGTFSYIKYNCLILLFVFVCYLEVSVCYQIQQTYIYKNQTLCADINVMSKWEENVTKNKCNRLCKHALLHEAILYTESKSKVFVNKYVMHLES